MVHYWLCNKIIVVSYKAQKTHFVFQTNWSPVYKFLFFSLYFSSAVNCSTATQQTDTALHWYLVSFYSLQIFTFNSIILDPPTKQQKTWFYFSRFTTQRRLLLGIIVLDMCFLSHAETFNRKQFVFAQFVLVFKLISLGFFVRYESLFTEHLGRLILYSWLDGGVMWPLPGWCWCSLEIAVVRRPSCTTEISLHCWLSHIIRQNYVPRNTSAKLSTQQVLCSTNCAM